MGLRPPALKAGRLQALQARCLRSSARGELATRSRGKAPDGVRPSMTRVTVGGCIRQPHRPLSTDKRHGSRFCFKTRGNVSISCKSNPSPHPSDAASAESEGLGSGALRQRSAPASERCEATAGDTRRFYRVKPRTASPANVGGCPRPFGRGSARGHSGLKGRLKQPGPKAREWRERLCAGLKGRFKRP